MKKYLAIVVLSVLAFANAAYLSHRAWYLSVTPAGQRPLSFCDANAVFSCTEVLDHPLSRVFGIPFPVVALFVYPVIFALAAYGYRSKSLGMFPALLGLGLAGLAFNGFFIYRETFFIHAYCPLCLLCTGIIATVAIISGFGVWERRKAA